MNEKSIRILEFPKILDMLADLSTSALGKELCKELLPATDIDYTNQGANKLFRSERHKGKP